MARGTIQTSPKAPLRRSARQASMRRSASVVPQTQKENSEPVEGIVSAAKTPKAHVLKVAKKSRPPKSEGNKSSKPLETITEEVPQTSPQEDIAVQQVAPQPERRKQPSRSKKSNKSTKTTKATKATKTAKTTKTPTESAFKVQKRTRTTKKKALSPKEQAKLTKAADVLLFGASSSRARRPENEDEEMPDVQEYDEDDDDIQMEDAAEVDHTQGDADMESGDEPDMRIEAEDEEMEDAEIDEDEEMDEDDDTMAMGNFLFNLAAAAAVDFDVDTPLIDAPVSEGASSSSAPLAVAAPPTAGPSAPLLPSPAPPAAEITAPVALLPAPPAAEPPFAPAAETQEVAAPFAATAAAPEPAAASVTPTSAPALAPAPPAELSTPLPAAVTEPTSAPAIAPASAVEPSTPAPAQTAEPLTLAPALAPAVEPTIPAPAPAVEPSVAAGEPANHEVGAAACPDQPVGEAPTGPEPGTSDAQVVAEEGVLGSEHVASTGGAGDEGEEREARGVRLIPRWTPEQFARGRAWLEGLSYEQFLFLRSVQDVCENLGVERVFNPLPGETDDVVSIIGNLLAAAPRRWLRDAVEERRRRREQKGEEEEEEKEDEDDGDSSPNGGDNGGNDDDDDGDNNGDDSQPGAGSSSGRSSDHADTAAGPDASVPEDGPNGDGSSNEGAAGPSGEPGSAAAADQVNEAARTASGTRVPLAELPSTNASAAGAPASASRKRAHAEGSGPTTEPVASSAAKSKKLKRDQPVRNRVNEMVHYNWHQADGEALKASVLGKGVVPLFTRPNGHIFFFERSNKDYYQPQQRHFVNLMGYEFPYARQYWHDKDPQKYPLRKTKKVGGVNVPENCKILWDAHTGWVKMTDLFWCCAPGKSTPGQALRANPGLKEISINPTGGDIANTQGIWVPMEAAVELAKKFCWPIREQLVPLFGSEFPGQCLPPAHAEYGKWAIDPQVVALARESLTQRLAAWVKEEQEGVVIPWAAKEEGSYRFASEGEVELAKSFLATGGEEDNTLAFFPAERMPFLIGQTTGPVEQGGNTTAVSTEDAAPAAAAPQSPLPPSGGAPLGTASISGSNGAPSGRTRSGRVAARPAGATASTTRGRGVAKKSGARGKKSTRASAVGQGRKSQSALTGVGSAGLVSQTPTSLAPEPLRAARSYYRKGPRAPARSLPVNPNTSK